MLAAGTVVQTSQAAAYAGLAVLAPVLRDQYDLSLTQVGVLLGAANAGALLTFLAWGLLADRIGERATAVVGLTGAAAGFAGAAYAPDFVSLVVVLGLANAFGASSNTATGRAVASWFPSSERGFALGIRQASVPVGGFAAALVIPAIAGRADARPALIALAAFSAVAAAIAAPRLVEGPIRWEEGDEIEGLRHPLRDRRIWRISLGSSILIYTQVALTGFVVLFLESQRELSHREAGAVLAGMNVIAIAGRLVLGRLSDRLGSRVALIRRTAMGTAVATAAVAGLVGSAGWLLVVALVVGGGLSMSWNGLAVTAVIESAAAHRSGAALGLQQTMLGTAVVVAPLVFAPFVAATSWRAGFAAAAVVPLIGLAVFRPLGR